MDQFKMASKKLKSHGIVAFPTETVMGLGVIYNDEIAYSKLNLIKRRPEDKPYSLMLKDIDSISKYALISDIALKIIKAFLPGPLTLLLPAKKDLPIWVTHGSGIVGIRVPLQSAANKLLNEIDEPLLVPSANRSGEKPAMNSKEVKDIFKDEIDYIIDGFAEGGVPSTIIDLSKDEIKIIRQGEISLDMVMEVLK